MSATAATDALPNAVASAEKPALIVDGLTTSIRVDRQWFLD